MNSLILTKQKAVPVATEGFVGRRPRARLVARQAGLRVVAAASDEESVVLMSSTSKNTKQDGRRGYYGEHRHLKHASLGLVEGRELTLLSKERRRAAAAAVRRVIETNAAMSSRNNALLMGRGFLRKIVSTFDSAGQVVKGTQAAVGRERYKSALEKVSYMTSKAQTREK
jgi:hypothetical protein